MGHEHSGMTSCESIPKREKCTFVTFVQAVQSCLSLCLSLCESVKDSI